MVAIKLDENSLLQNLVIKHVLPTAESPMKSILKTESPERLDVICSNSGGTTNKQTNNSLQCNVNDVRVSGSIQFPYTSLFQMQTWFQLV